MRASGFGTAAAIALLSLSGWASAAGAQPKGDSCVTCHEVLGDERLSSPVETYRSDIHAAKGFGCAACHGGDPGALGLAAMDPAKGFVGTPRRQEVLQVCGHCHSDADFMKRYNPSIRVDQVAEYVTSVHGRRLVGLGDERVATCVNCHPAHSIKPPSDPASSVHPPKVADTCGSCHADADYMAPYPIPTDQLAKYRESVHWQALSEKGDLSAPTCNDCHGNHGAAPPGFSWVGNVCGQCHSVMADLFASSRHAQIFTLMGTPGCATCHGNHAIRQARDEMLGLGEEAVCARCHSAGDRGGEAAATMRSLVDSLRAEYEEAHALLLRAERAGMEVSQAQFELNAARNALLEARTAVHAFSVDSVKREVDGGLQITAAAHARGQRALKELQFRRIGLAVSVAIILALIAGLVFKIRQFEGKA